MIQGISSATHPRRLREIAEQIRRKLEALEKEVGTVTPFARTLLDDPDAATAKATLGILTVGAPQSATGGSVTLSGVPAGANRVTVIFSSVSTTASAQIYLRLGDSGGIEATGYTGQVGAMGAGGTVIDTFTTEFRVLGDTSASGDNVPGHVTLTRTTGNTWVASWVLAEDAGQIHSGAGVKTLSGELTQIEVIANGTTFDAGSLSFFAE